MARKNTQAADHIPDAGKMPPWFDADIHRVETRGIVLAATGDLLAEDGLPVNAAARNLALAALAAPETTEAPEPAAPADEQE